MKRVLCAALTVLFLFVCLAGCGNKNQVDPKLCFLHNNSLSLTSDKETIVRVENLKCYDEDINMYIPKEDEYCIIDGIDFIDIYFFNEDDLFREVTYTFAYSDKEDVSPYFEKMGKYLNSIYGTGNNYSDEEIEEWGYTWEVSDGKSNSYEICLSQSGKYNLLEIAISATGDGRSQAEKAYDDSVSALGEAYDDLAEKIKDFQEGVDNASPIENYKIFPKNDLITQQQFDLLEEDISYEDAMKILDSPKDRSIPENETSFFCEWKGDSVNKYVFLVFSDNNLISKNSSGLE